MIARPPQFRAVDQHTGTVATDDRGVARPLSPQPAPPSCGLTRHHPGRRVQFTRWNTADGAMEIVRGRVLAHKGRTVTIRTDAGEEVWTSCGHVIAVRRGVR